LKKKYDFLILGSGLGGLQTAYILSKNGFSVCVLEKNPKIGGTLQSFRRFGCDFSTGMHYLGSLDEGQMLNRIFKYFKLFDGIEYKRMDEDGFEIIELAGKKYKYPMGWDNFRRQFLEYFPGKEKVIDEYISLIKRAVNSQALYSLRQPGEELEILDGVLMSSAYELIKSLCSDVEVVNYLSALNFDYGGEKGKTPFYVHALVTNYFVRSSYKIVGDSDLMANALANSIKSFGGEIYRRREVTSLLFEDKELLGAECTNGEKYFADKVISNIHPANTMDLIGEGKIKKIYRNRMLKLENTISSFSLNIKMKDGVVKYFNHNYQYFSRNDVWYASYYDEKKWPEHFFLYLPPCNANGEFARCLQIVTYMKYDEVKKWEGSNRRKRPQEYLDWKAKKAEQLLDYADKKIPGLKEGVEGYDITTPLSFRDYIGNNDGSMYGRMGNSQNITSFYVSHKTKIPNLYLTGQNINLHGMLGVSISSLVTTGEFVSLSKTLDEIKNG